MIGVIGRISCIYKTRVVLFKEEPSLIDVVERYYDVITDSEDPATEAFLDALARHISAGPVQNRSRGQTRRVLRNEIGSAPASGKVPLL
jgi:hypothetical protein